jgi:hypothetical protein
MVIIYTTYPFYSLTVAKKGNLRLIGLNNKSGIILLCNIGHISLHQRRNFVDRTIFGKVGTLTLTLSQKKANNRLKSKSGIIIADLTLVLQRKGVNLPLGKDRLVIAPFPLREIAEVALKKYQGRDLCPF